MGFRQHGFMAAAAEKAKFDPKLLRRALQYMLPYKLTVGLSILTVFVVTASDLARPYLMSRAIDRDIIRGDVAGLFSTLALYLVMVLTNAATTTVQVYVTGWVGQKVIYDLRASVFSHLQSLSLSFFDGRERGDTISRLTSDIDLLNEMVTNSVVNLVNTVFTLGGIVVIMLAMDLRLSLLTFSIIPLMLVVTQVFRQWVGEAYRVIRKKVGDITAHIEEGISGVRIIQSFAQEDRDFAAFRDVNEASREANLEAASVRAVYFPAVDVTGSIGIGLVLFFGGVSMLRGDLSVGILVAFVMYLFRFFQPVRNLTVLYDNVLASMAAAERIFELLDTQPDIQDAADAFELPRIEGLVEFNDVGFRYVEDQPVLQHFGIVAKPGEMIALVGATGAGKTTTISLLSRMYDIDEGSITVDGHDLRDIAVQSLRRQLGIVLQEGFLFSGSVRDNIRYGRLEATDEEVEEAATAVGAHEFIMRLPEGYDSEVRERGEKLSMGERQLICLARALVADPRILILDEATSSVDPYTELIIQSALLKLFQGRTSIVIAHRLSTVRRADRIYVVDAGRVAEEGPHEELLAQGGLYSKLYEMQFKSQEELQEGLQESALELTLDRESS